jgi:hypothetical protein
LSCEARPLKAFVRLEQVRCWTVVRGRIKLLVSEP